MDGAHGYVTPGGHHFEQIYDLPFLAFKHNRSAYLHGSLLPQRFYHHPWLAHRVRFY